MMRLYVRREEKFTQLESITLYLLCDTIDNAQKKGGHRRIFFIVHLFFFFSESIKILLRLAQLWSLGKNTFYRNKLCQHIL